MASVRDIQDARSWFNDSACFTEEWIECLDPTIAVVINLGLNALESVTQVGTPPEPTVSLNSPDCDAAKVQSELYEREAQRFYLGLEDLRAARDDLRIKVAQLEAQLGNREEEPDMDDEKIEVTLRMPDLEKMIHTIVALALERAQAERATSSANDEAHLKLEERRMALAERQQALAEQEHALRERECAAREARCAKGEQVY
jgi:hypothetical protein